MPVKKIVKKSELDKFYTKPVVAKWCIDILEKHVEPTDLFIEPSAGSGSFYNLLPNPKIGYDLAPECDGVIEADWLDQHPAKGCVIAGNPPFGNRNSLTNSFIRHAIKFAKCVAFILPSVYRKETMQKVFSDDWALVEDHQVRKNAFTLNGEDYHVPCVFQIWVNKAYYQELVDIRESTKLKAITDHFSFSSKDESPYFIFGAAPNKIIESSMVTVTNRGYYLQANSSVIGVLSNIDWKQHGLSSVNGGVSWFSKQQMIDIYVAHVDENKLTYE